MPPVAVVTGASRGIGREVARQLAADHGFDVVAAARNPDDVDLDGVRAAPLDVTDDGSVAALAASLDAVDVLVNNAGVSLGKREPALEASLDDMRGTYDVNLLGPLRLVQALAPLLRASAHGRIVNVSTGMASLSDSGTGVLPYRSSKTALNLLTVVLAKELADDGVLVNAACPGWVRTDMGGPHAMRSVEEGAASVVWAATLPDDGPTGGFFRDGNPLDW